MAKITIESKLIAALDARGHRKVLSRSKKYEVFESGETGVFLYVGRAGALRKGRTVTESYSLEGTPFRAALLKEWELAHVKTAK